MSIIQIPGGSGAVANHIGDIYVIQDADLHDTSAAGGAAQVSLPAPTDGSHWVIAGALCGYSAAPTGGGLSVTCNGVTFPKTPVTAAGAAPISFPVPVVLPVNTAATVDLAAGGGAVVADLSAFAWLEK